MWNKFFGNIDCCHSLIKCLLVRHTQQNDVILQHYYDHGSDSFDVILIEMGAWALMERASWNLTRKFSEFIAGKPKADKHLSGLRLSR